MILLRIIAALLFLATPAHALLKRSAPFQANAQINIGQNDLPGALMNFLKTASPGFQGTDTPAKTDINGYPIAALNTNFGQSFTIPTGLYTTSTVFVAKWPSTRAITFTLNNGQTVTNCFTTPTCTTGSSSQSTLGGTGAGCTTADPYWGNGCRVEFTFNSVSSQISAFYPGGTQNYAPGSGDFIIIRKSDEAAYNAFEATGNVAGAFTPEFLAQIKGLHPKTVRVMGFNSTNFSVENTWGLRTTLSSFSYVAPVFGPNWWAGGPASSGAINCTGSGSTCSSDAYTATAATNTPGTITDGEVIQGVVNFSNATTTPTLNIGGRGAKGILNNYGTALSIGGIAQGNATFTYNANLGKYLYALGAANGIWNGGNTYSVPVEVSVALANAVNANLWDTYPAMSLASYQASRATTVLGLLNSGLNYYVEYANENWNPAFPAFQYDFQSGAALGFPSGSNRQLYGWQSLASIQLFKSVAASWSGQTSRLVNVLGVQYCCASSDYNTYFLQSADLNGATFPAYCAYVGGTYSGGICTGDPDYFQSPNRAIDQAAKNAPGVIAGAPYYQGAAFTGGNYSSQSAYAIAALQTMLTDFASGGSGIATAEALLDADIRYGILNSQTVTFSGATATISGTNSFYNGLSIVFVSTGTLPTGIATATPYFVINNTGSTFQIAAYPGGSAITPSGGSGSLSAGQNGGSTTLLDLVANYYGSNNSTLLGWQNYITAGSYNVTVQAYEGGYQMVAPQTSDCTTMGITAPPIGGGAPTAAGCSAQASALLSAYLNSNYSSALVTSQFNQFRGRDATQVNSGLVPADTVPSMLADQNTAPWNMCPGQTGNLMCYPAYSAFATYH